MCLLYFIYPFLFTSSFFIVSFFSTAGEAPRSGVVNLERLNTLRPQDYNIEVMSTLKSWCKPDGKQRAPFI